MPARKSKASTSHLLERPRLLNMLLAATDQKLIALLAPAGYGKTTLAKQYVEKRKGKTAWLTLREDAADPNTLARDLMYEASRVVPKLKFLHTEEALSIEARANRLGVMLARDLNALSTNLLVVLDRIEFLSKPSSSLLEALIEDLGEGHQVLVTGYDVTPLPIARYVTDNSGLKIGDEDLNFTIEESTELLTARDFQGDIDQVQDRLNGWPLGLAMLGKDSWRSDHPNEVMKSLFDRLPYKTQRWVSELAPLSVWSIKTAMELSCEVPNGWLKLVVKFGLPVIKINESHYIPHSLLSELLQKRLLDRENRGIELYEKAGILAEKSGQLLEALKYFCVAKKIENSLRLITELSRTYIIRRENVLARQVLEMVPEENLSSELQVRLANQWLSMGEAQRADLKIQELYKEGYRGPDLYMILSTLEYQKSNSKTQIEYANKGLEQNPPVRLKVGLLVMKFAALYEMKEIKLALKVAKETIEIAKNSSERDILSVALKNAAIVYAEMGERKTSESLFEEAIEINERLGLQISTQGIFNNLSSYLTEWGQYQKSRILIDRGLIIARKSQSSWLPLLLFGDGLNLAYQGFHKTAIPKFEEALPLCDKFLHEKQKVLILCNLVQSNLFIEENESAKNYWHILETQNNNIKDDTSNIFPLTESIFHFYNEDYKLSLKILEGLNIDLAYSDTIKFRICAYLAECNRKTGKEWKNYVDKMFFYLDIVNKDIPLRIDLSLLKGLYHECISVKLYDSRIRSVLSSDLENSKPVRLILNINTIGNHTISILGKSLKIPLKRSKELLLWLVFQNFSTRTEIIRGVWNEPETSKNREYFKISVRKLRMALLENSDVYVDPLPFENGIYRLHELFEVRWDYLDLQGRFENGLSTSEDIQTVLQCSKVFLVGFDSEWIQEFKRSALEGLHQAVLGAANRSKHEDPHQALRLYEAAIALEPFSEQAYIAMADLLRDLQRPEEALQIQRQFARALDLN
jgi:LuxR family transcriptional regulator, maltose regulon positive regulatory protein